MKTQKNVKRFSLILSLILILAMIKVNPSFSKVAAEGDILAAIGSDTVWSYLDNGTDPAGDKTAAGYERTSWAKSSYDASSWNTAKGSFGAKRGAIADLGGGCTPDNLVNQYKENGSSDIEAFFFRTTINIADASKVTKIAGSVIYDDAATVYVNGIRIAGFDDDGLTENIMYGGSNAGEPKTGNIEVTDAALIANAVKTGDNVVAVEIHQGRESSSDIYFEMPELQFSSEKIVYTQKNISLNVGKNETEMNFTWYANVGGEGKLYVAKNSDVSDGVMPESAAVYSATGSAGNKSGFYSYQTTATGLIPDTTYAYQLVNDSTKSEIKTFTTTGGGAFSFAFAGDPQIGASGNAVSDTDGWDKTLDIVGSGSVFAGVDFLLSAGDQVNTANNESQYDGYLDHDTLQKLPTATVIGNHDSGSSAYSEHFNNPNESANGASAAGTDYYFVYNNVLFMVINSNNTSTAEHKAFMENAISSTSGQNIEWKIVTFHHSIYSVASHALEDSIITRREELVPVFKELDIDVVLMGHDHVYCRTYMMDGLTPMTDASIYDNADYSSITNPEGILYVTANSASGSKFYSIKNVDFPYSRVMNQENVPNISRVDVSDNKLTITTYRTSDLSQVDTFTINRTHVHTLEAVDAVEATCTEAGSIAYYMCKECGECFSDADATVEISAEDIVIAAAGHKYGSWKVTKEATATEDGSRQRSCMVCNDIETDIIPAGTDISEDTEDTEDTEDVEDTEDTEDMEDTEDTENTQDNESTENTEDASNNNGNTNNVKTGDASPVAAIAVIGALAFITAGICLYLNRRKKNC